MIWVRTYYTMKLLLYSIALFFGNTTLSEAYVYPVAYGASSSIIVMQQYESGKLRLIRWDPSTQSADLMLPGYYYPVEVSMLPDHSGIGFIDNDRLRIQYFNKRSATTYDIHYPLCGLNSLTWAGSHDLFCTARYQGRYALCYISLNKPYCVRIIADEQSDYLYPSWIQDTLFYIERATTAQEVQYSIKMIDHVRTQFEENEEGEENGDACVQVSLPCNTQTIAYFGSTPIMHTHLECPDFGWVIGLPQDLHAQHLVFTCYIVHYAHHVWHSTPAFVFSIPRTMLLSDDPSHKLSESLRPLLPRYIRGTLYFCSSHEGDFVRIYRYTLSNATIECLTSPQIQQHLFAPLDLGSMVVCGSKSQDCIWQLFDAPEEATALNNCFKLYF